MILGSYSMKFFDENYLQEIPTCIKCLRKKYNLIKKGCLSWQPFFNPHP